MDSLPVELMRQIIPDPDAAAAIMCTWKGAEQCMRGLVGRLFDVDDMIARGELVEAIGELGRERIMKSRWHIARDGVYMVPAVPVRSRWLHVCWGQHKCLGGWMLYARTECECIGDDIVFLYSGRFNAAAPQRYMCALSSIDTFCTNGYFYYTDDAEACARIARFYKYPTILFKRK